MKMINTLYIRKSTLLSVLLLLFSGNISVLNDRSATNIMLAAAFTPVYPSSQPSPTAPPTTRLNEYYGDYSPPVSSPKTRARRCQPTAGGGSTTISPAAIRMDGLLRMSNRNHGAHNDDDDDDYYDDFGEDFCSEYFDSWSDSVLSSDNLRASSSQQGYSLSASNTCGDGDCMSLEWNLSNLLTQDQSTDPKLIPLIDVCDAASKAMENDPSLESLQSMQYNGELADVVAPYRMFIRNYNQDIGHDGRFSVFTSNNEGATLQSDVVFSKANPLEYVRNVLSTSDFNKKKPNNYGKGETVVFVPGLHTLHEANGKNDGERTSTERVRYYSQVLDGLPMAQIHAGTFSDQKKDIVIEITRDTLFALQSFGLLVKETEEDRQERRRRSFKRGEKVRCRLNTKDLDIIRTVVSRANLAPFSIPGDGGEENPSSSTLKKTLLRLVDVAVKSTLAGSLSTDVEHTSRKMSPHLVLMANSASCSIVASALAEWKHHQIKGGESVEKMDQLLRDAVTVVTMGAVCETFVDGPAYIHVSMHDDSLASSWGPSKDREGGGKDAVYLNGISPYVCVSSEADRGRRKNKKHYGGLDENDAHNMDACAVQYLSLVRRINAISSFRNLYDVASQAPDQLDISASLFAINYQKLQKGQLEMPPHLDDELLPSMIRATGGDRWLFNPKVQLGEDGVDGDDSPLPSLDYAEGFLTNQLGYNIYDEIVKACG